MYKIILAMVLAYSAYGNARKLMELEGGFSAFQPIHWIMLVLSVLMVPLSVFTFIRGWKEYRADKEQEREEEEQRKAEASKEKFGELDGPDPDMEEEVSDRADRLPCEGREGASKYDS